MTETTNSIELNLKEDYNYKYLYAKQYDKKSRYVNAKIYDGEQLLTISPEDTIVRIRCTKPDKTYVLYDVEQANIKDNTIRFELTEQMLAKEGTVRCDIGLYTTLVNKETLVKEGESLISTAVFYINVEKAGYSEDAICSSSEFSALTNALIKVEEAAKIAEEARLATEMTNKAREEIEESFADIEDRFEYIETTTGAVVEASLTAIESAKQAKISENKAKQSEVFAGSSADTAFAEAERAKFYSEEAENSFLDTDNIKTQVDTLLFDFNMNIDNFRKKTEPIIKTDLHTNLQDEINAKADIADTRLKSDAITEADLDYALAQKINNSGSGSGSGGIIVSGAQIDDTTSSYSTTNSSKEIDRKIKTAADSKVNKDGSKGLSECNFTTIEKMKLSRMENDSNYYIHPPAHPAAMISTDSQRQFVTTLQLETFKDKYTKAEVDNIVSSLALGMVWKDPVDTFADIAIKYPQPENNWTLKTLSDGATYTYNATDGEWIKTGNGEVPLATEAVNGLLSSGMYTKLINIEENANHYKHPDKHSMEEIEETETKKIFTSEERTLLSGLTDSFDAKLQDYRRISALIQEADLDPVFINKIFASGGININDNLISTKTTLSSAEIEKRMKNPPHLTVADFNALGDKSGIYYVCDN